LNGGLLSPQPSVIMARTGMGHSLLINPNGYVRFDLSPATEEGANAARITHGRWREFVAAGSPHDRMELRRANQGCYASARRPAPVICNRTTSIDRPPARTDSGAALAKPSRTNWASISILKVVRQHD
jgi:hypothetical protein